jgi:hypothetical protein
MSDWMRSEVQADLLDVQKKIDSLTSEMREFIVAVTAQAKMVNNLGDYTFDLIAEQEENWSIRYALTPALGYARRLLFLNPDDNKHLMNGLDLPGPTNPWCQAIAGALVRADSGRFTHALIPGASQLGQALGAFAPNERPMGVLITLTEQLKQVLRYYMLYDLQGTLLTLHANRRYYDANYELSWAVDMKARPALERQKEMRDALLTLPLHPFISYIASALTTGKVASDYGIKDALYRYGDNPRGSEATDPNTPFVRSHFAAQMVEQAVSDMVSSSPSEWGDAEFRSQSITSISTLMRRIRSTGSIWDGLSAAAQALGWSDVRAGDVGTLSQNGCDFVLCDGLSYSDDPTASLLGLRPTLSLGNTKVMGFDIKYRDKFNRDNKHQIRASVIVVKGYQGANASEGVLNRIYIPSGMSMGESPAESVFAESAVEEPVIRAMLDRYQREVGANGVIVVQHYRDADDANSVMLQTDWDGWSIGTEKVEVQGSYVRGYAKYLEPLRAVRFLHRDIFYHRSVAFMSRTDTIDFYNELGGFKTSLSYRGRLLFNNEVSVMHAPGSLEMIVEAAPMQSTTTHKSPAGGAADQVHEIVPDIK